MYPIGGIGILSSKIPLLVALSFKTDKTTPGTFQVTNDDPINNPVTWSDGTDVYIGDTATFLNWFDNSVKTVFLLCANPSLITQLTGSQWVGDSITEVQLGVLDNLTSAVNFNNNNISVFGHAPSGNTITKMELLNNDLPDFDWDNHPNLIDLNLEGNTNCGSIGLTIAIAGLKLFKYQGTSDIDLSSITSLATNSTIEILSNVDYIQIGGIGSGSISRMEFKLSSATTLTITNYTKFSNTGVYLIQNCDSLIAINNPTVTAGAVVFSVKFNDVLPSIDISGFIALITEVEINVNPLLETIILPTITITSKLLLTFNNNNLGYVDITVLTDVTQFDDYVFNIKDNNQTGDELADELIDHAMPAEAESGGGNFTLRVFTGGGSNSAPSETIRKISSLDNAGTGYLATEVLTITGGGGTSATITIDSVGGSGEILTYSLLAAGSGYVTQPTSYTGGSGSGADFTVYSGIIAKVFLIAQGYTVTVNS